MSIIAGNTAITGTEIEMDEDPYADDEYMDDDQGLTLEELEQSDNICELLDDANLTEIGSRALQELAIDKASRSDWDKSMEEAMDLALQVKKEKTFPWPNAANVRYPLITTAAIQFNARAYPAIVPGRDIVKIKVNGDDTGLFRAQVDPSTGLPMMDPQTGEPVGQWVIPPGAKRARADRVGRHMSWQVLDEMDDWEANMDRLLMVLPIIGVAFKKTYYTSEDEKNCSELVLPNCLHVHYKAASLEKAPRLTHEFDLYPHEITERIRAGMYREFDFQQKSADPDAPHVFYEQHRLLDLDDDGYPEPYIVTVHEESQTVVRIVARFGEVTMNGSEVAKIEPIHYFTKYGFIPNPDSAIYDLGFGILLGPINETVNTVLNQMLDAGTLQNAGGGFFGKGLRIKGGPLKFRPGQYMPVDVTGSKIAENIYQMQHQGPSAVLLQLMGVLIEAGKEISSTKDVVTGSAQGANASPTTTIALIEQGLKQFSATFKRIHRSLKSEFKKLYELNQMYLPQKSYFTFMDNQEAVARTDYADDLDVTPVSDPSVVTDMQRMAKAQFLGQYKGDPFFNQIEIRRRELEAAGIENIDSLLQEPPQQGPAMADQLKAMELELAGMLEKAKLPSEIAKNFASAIKDIAYAEEKEAGTQLEAYKMILERLIPNGSSDSGGAVQGMAGESGNGGLPAISQ